MSDDTTDVTTEEGRLTRRELVRRAGVGAAALTVGGAAAPYSFAGPLRYKGRWLKGDLAVLQWAHFVPVYDDWFDHTWAVKWGQANDVQVKVDHINNTQIPARAAAEVAAQQGHDLVGFLSPPAAYEDQVIDHSHIVQEVEAKVGPIGDLAHKSTYNPRTKKYFGFSDNYVPDPVIWRHDLWNNIGEAPYTWEHVRKAAPKLKAMGHPIGIGMSNELDSNMANIAFMQCFGSYIQNEEAHCIINSKNTVEALTFMADIYNSGETSEIFGWNPASNNQYLYSGKASMILNAISASRTPEDLGLPFTKDLWIWPIPSGPVQRLGLEHVMGVYVVWKFAQNKAAASKFLADLAINYQQAFIASKFYNFPSFPGAVKNIGKQLAADQHPPLGKYTVLGTIAKKYTTNIGHPGYTNAAIDEIFSTFLIPQMFAQVAQGNMSASDAASAAQKAMNAIFAKWRDAKKI